MRAKIGALLLALALLTGCAPKAPVEMVNPIRFYVCAPEDEIGLERPAGALTAQTVDLGRADLTINEILARYLATAQAPFPEGLECTALMLEDGTLSLTFNDAFATLSGVELSLAAAALTLTLTQIEGVEKISIHCQGMILSDDWQETFTSENFLFTDTSPVHPETAVQLYFLIPGQGLNAQRRVLSYTDKTELPELAMQALLADPGGGGLTRAVPEGTKLLDLSLDNGLCTVVLSEEFSACDTDALTAENAVHAIVLTLCSLDLVDAVQVQLLGGSELQYCAIDRPLSPEPDWIQN